MSSDPTETLYVRGLPNDTRQNELARLFEDMPGYESCRVVPGIKELTFGFVTFSSIDDAQDAKEEKGDLEFEGHPLSIQFAKPKEERERREREKIDRKEKEKSFRDQPPVIRQKSPVRRNREHDYNRDQGKKSVVNAQAMGPYENAFRNWEHDNRMNNPSHEDCQEGALCIMGLPRDITERELIHLLRPFDGFCGCDLLCGDINRDPLAFATFTTRIVTQFAIKMLNGYEFDLDHRLKVQVKRSSKSARGSKGGDRNRDNRDRNDRGDRGGDRNNDNNDWNDGGKGRDRKGGKGPRAPRNDQSDDRGYIGNREWR